MFAELFVSRLPVGSSHSSRLGEPTRARAIATRCRSPPDSLVGRKSMRCDEADPFDRRERAVPPAAGRPAAVHLRQHYVLKHCPIRQQVERLEHEPDALAPQTCPLLVGQCGGFHAVQSVEPAGRAIQAANDVQQRRFAGAGRPRDRQPLALLQREIDIDERVNRRLGAVLLADPAEFENPEQVRRQSSRIPAGRVVVADHDELARRELPIERTDLHIAVRGQARLHCHVLQRPVLAPPGALRCRRWQATTH